MIVLIKILLLISLLLILYQDIKERQIWVILLPIFAITGAVLFYSSVVSDLFYYSIPINLALVGILLLINYLFARFILKKSLFKEALGAGDLLFFIGFAVSFPTISFINFFVFSLLFSLVLHFLAAKIVCPERSRRVKVLKSSRETFTDINSTIPLAGYMSIFLIAVYSSHWLGFYNVIYLF